MHTTFGWIQMIEGSHKVWSQGRPVAVSLSSMGCPPSLSLSLWTCRALAGGTHIMQDEPEKTASLNLLQDLCQLQLDPFWTYTAHTTTRPQRVMSQRGWRWLGSSPVAMAGGGGSWKVGRRKAAVAKQLPGRNCGGRESEKEWGWWEERKAENSMIL